MQPDKPATNTLHSTAYRRMLERAREFLDATDESLRPRLGWALERARETAAELGELTREEADLIAAYLKRDLHDAAQYLKDTRNDFADWLRFDLELIEDRLADTFSGLVDHSRVELGQLEQQARDANLWHTGEITGPGTLVCDDCGEAVRFHAVKHIPACPKCKGTRYRRMAGGS